MKIVVTGGRGFIGSHFVQRALRYGHTIVDIDKITYASSRKLEWDNHPKYTSVKEDISEISHLPSCDILINFAAESHVDNSISSSDVFVKSNILGVHNLLELVRGKQPHDRPLFFHISTDEVYGDILEGEFTEKDMLNPSNPYSASKAAAEMLITAYQRTYNINYIITRSSNNYGERQYEEKLIPKCIECIATGKKIPLHGDGTYIRDWIYVKDNVDALFFLIKKRPKNQVFNIAAENYLTNIEVADSVLNWYGHGREKIVFVQNRWGQDLRYAIDISKIKKLGWKPSYSKGIHKWV